MSAEFKKARDTHHSAAKFVLKSPSDRSIDNYSALMRVDQITKYIVLNVKEKKRDKLHTQNQSGEQTMNAAEAVTLMFNPDLLFSTDILGKRSRQKGKVYMQRMYLNHCPNYYVEHKLACACAREIQLCQSEKC